MSTNRVAFVTGGNRGIGLACAQRLASAGHQVAVGSRSKPEDLPAELTWVECDVTNTSSVESAFATIEAGLGAVEILVANAGISKDALLARTSEEDFNLHLDANLTGSFRVAKRAVRPMMRGRWGRIVLISSIVAYMGGPGQAAYAASKAGMVGFARSMARELATRSITVNVVAPGAIETDMLAAAPQSSIEATVAATPAGRAGSPDEVAAAVNFLASDEASYITGTTLRVDGGLAMGI